MKDYECTLGRFLDDVKSHKIEVIRNDGVHRHLKFRGERYTNWFDLITWNGHLCIVGDMGCFVFSRIEDMFDFFIMSDNDFSLDKSKELSINAGYWGEKLVSVSTHGGYKKFSEDEFRETIKKRFDDSFEDETDSEKKDECWEEIENNVLCHGDNEYEAMRAAIDFEHDGFTFQDFWEFDCKRYTFQYIWCLYAIVWGILKYRKDCLVEP